MIRPANSSDYTEITALWLQTTIKAQSFIVADYWKNNWELVKKELLPKAETFVYIDKHQIKGFISVFEGNYIGALFVSEKFQSVGLGRRLLEYVRRQRPNLSLRVYVKNRQAISFYQKCGFKIVAETVDEKTQENELLMSWAKGCLSGYLPRFQGDS